jgi:hypothetical protein
MADIHNEINRMGDVRRRPRLSRLPRNLPSTNVRLLEIHLGASQQLAIHLSFAGKNDKTERPG